MRIIGLMSGTSLDGIDAALVDFADNGDFKMLAFTSTEYPPQKRELLHEAIVNGDAAALCIAHAELGEWFAIAARQVIEAAGLHARDITAIGSHGQTVWHVPPAGTERGSTLQLGCPATIAERTGIAVVSDFRSRDMAAGGHGAPLVPFVDRLLFSHPSKRRVLQNIGGVANLTWVPRRGETAPLVAFDTGPGNTLINSAVEIATNGNESFDRDGMRAARGRIDAKLLAELMADEYYTRQPPKSTGREYFGKPYVQEIVRRHPELESDSLVATLTALTARTIADAMQAWVITKGVDEIVVTGGGSRNPTLMRWLAEALAPVPVLSGREAGVDPDAKEAIAFAALAWAHLKRIPGNVPEATGARGPRILGSYTPGTPEESGT